MARSIVVAGGRVVLLGRREALLRDATADLGQHSSYLVHDVTKTSATPGFANRVEAPFGPISILINNAGIHLKKPALATTEDEFQLVLATHVLGAHAITQGVSAFDDRSQSGLDHICGFDGVSHRVAGCCRL